MRQTTTTSSLTTEAFQVILERFAAPLARFVYSLLRNTEDSHDLVQDVFVDAWRATQRQRSPFTAGSDERAVRNWLYHAAYCDAVSVLRHRGVITWESLDRVDMADTASPSSWHAPVPFEDRIIERAVLSAALAMLEPADIACLQLSVIEGFTSVEMARVLDIAHDAARKRLSRAMYRLRAAYLVQERHPDDPAQDNRIQNHHARERDRQ